MSIYSMNCFKLPKGICEDINRVLTGYWWGSIDEKRKLHYVAWNRMSLPNKEGGLRFKDIEHFNTALLEKQVWRIFQHLQCLMARVLKGRYFYYTNIVNAPNGYKPSYSWKSILQGRDLLKKGMRFFVRNGKAIQLWQDN